jgi:hypothetical protein
MQIQNRTDFMRKKRQRNAPPAAVVITIADSFFHVLRIWFFVE